MFHRNKAANHIFFLWHCSHHILEKMSFLVFACLFLLERIHSLTEQKIVPPPRLKVIPSVFCCGNRKLNCRLFQANNQKTSCKRTLSYSLNSTFTSRFTRTITAKKKENTELINADRKPYKNDNLKYNK